MRLETAALVSRCGADLSGGTLQASAQKVAALTRASAAEATAEQAFQEVGDMRDQLADLRDRLNQVCPPLAHISLHPGGSATTKIWQTVGAVCKHLHSGGAAFCRRKDGLLATHQEADIITCKAREQEGAKLAV